MPGAQRMYRCTSHRNRKELFEQISTISVVLNDEDRQAFESVGNAGAAHVRLMSGSASFFCAETPDEVLQ